MSNPVIKSPYPQILTGTTAPTMTPSFIGQEYYNTADGSMYKAMGTSGYWNWGMVGRGSLSEFNKNTIPGIFAWYDANELSTITLDSSSRVIYWKDKSGKGKDLIKTTGGGMDPVYAPTYEENGINNKYSVFFNGALTKRLYTAEFSVVAQPFTWVIVTRQTNVTTSGLQTIHDGAYNPNPSGARNVLNKQNGSINVTMYAGGDVDAGNALTTFPEIRFSCYNGASSYHIKNNGNKTTINPGAESLAGIMIGTDINLDGPGYFHLGEMIIYNRALSDNEIDIVRTYLNNKYAIY